ncbi:MAG: aminotransferase class V-fold PLP-dependent enzyme [Candidatus Odinarchaeota archaeon]
MDGIKRDLFPILRQKYYFNTCSVGPLAIPVKKAIEKYLDQWDSFGGLAWGSEDGWMVTVEKARALFAKLINAKPENIAYSFGNSTAISSVTSCFTFNQRNEVVFNELDFPATATHLMAKSVNGAKYRVAKSSDGKTVTLDEYKKVVTKKTCLITTCHVVSNTGFRIDENEMVEFAREREIPVFLDAYQSLGAIPLDVRKLDVDFVASGCFKWLLGGSGISFLYVRDDWFERAPGSIGWMGVDEPFADLLDKLRTTLHRPSDARRFQYGTPYPVGATSAYAGMKIIDEIGVSKIENQNSKLTQRLIEGVTDAGLTTLTPEEPEKRGSIVNVQVREAGKVVEDLQRKDFVLDMRSNGIRVSPHFFNSYEDVDRLLDVLKN